MPYLYAVQMMIPRYPFCPVKVGYSADPEKRRQSYTEGPFPVRWIGTWTGEKEDERDFHERYAECRLNGEWFIPTPEMIDEIHSAIVCEDIFCSVDLMVDEAALDGETELQTRERLFGGYRVQ